MTDLLERIALRVNDSDLNLIIASANEIRQLRFQYYAQRELLSQFMTSILTGEVVLTPQAEELRDKLEDVLRAPKLPTHIA